MNRNLLTRPRVENNAGRWRQLIAAGRLLLIAALIPNSALANSGTEQWKFSDVDRVVAISDVHGAYSAMVGTLKNAGVLDESLHWSAGSTHLVITGDLLDRGPDSRRVMDLVMSMEPEAEAAGGALHLLLGNHEVMNLVGDLRYVSVEEYAAFAGDESPAERDRWFRIYYDQKTLVTDEAALRKKFDEDRPPGFFAHRRAFRADGLYGKWLLSKPMIVVVNDTAYVHGGLAPVIAEIGLEGVNGKMKSELVTYIDQLGLLYDAGLLAPAVNFYDHAKVLATLPIDVERAADLAAAIKVVSGLSEAAVHDPDSPLWYRGNVGCGPLIEIDRIEAALARIGARRVVIGHTPTQTRRILSRLNGRVIEIDTGMLNGFYGGSGNALVVEGDTMTVVNQEDPDINQVVEHPRRVGIRKKGVSAEDLRNVLENGIILSSERIDKDHSEVKLSLGGVTIDATFVRATGSRGFVPELAAYRLDRFLDLDMVPVTVKREVDGRGGTLQFKPESMLDEAQRNSGRRGNSAWCPLPEQWGAMYVFDALIHNPGRGPQNMLYSPDYWQLILTGHDESFTSSGTRPKYLKGVALAIGSGWQEKLALLNDDVLETQFGDVLDKRRRKSLARRRDELLKDAME